MVRILLFRLYRQLFSTFCIVCLSYYYGHCMEDNSTSPQDSAYPGGSGDALSTTEAQSKENHEPALDRSRTLLLARLSDVVNTSGDLAAVCGAVIAAAGGLFEAAAGSVFLSAGPQYLRYIAGFGLPTGLISQVEDIAVTGGSPQFLLAAHEPTIVHDIASSYTTSVYRDLLMARGIVSLASFQLKNRGKLLGFMTVYHETARSYTDEEKDVLLTLANLLALSVANLQFTEAKRGEDKARDRFLSALSHELRTPLTSILGFTQVIRKRLSSAPGTDNRLLDQLEVLWTQAQRLNRLIDTFVDLSNIERGEFEINLGKVDLPIVLRAAVAQALGQARSRQPVETQVSEPSIWVHGDGKRLEQVFTHIVSNAIRYSPPEQPVLVICRMEKMQGRVIIDVSDKGPGIPSNLRKDIFERSNPGDAQRSGGLGVGLYLSKTVVEAHGGHIALQSSPLEGTTITITLPI